MHVECSNAPPSPGKPGKMFDDIGHPGQREASREFMCSVKKIADSKKKAFLVVEQNGKLCISNEQFWSPK